MTHKRPDYVSRIPIMVVYHIKALKKNKRVKFSLLNEIARIQR